MVTAVAATTETYALGEGPVWDAARGRLLWVDILAGVVHTGRLSGQAIVPGEIVECDGLVGAVAVAADGTLLLAAHKHLEMLTVDGRRVRGPRIVPATDARCLNDGAVDPAGRFLVGTMDLGAPSQREVLVRLEPDGRVTELDSDLTLSNGLAWSTDGRRMFSADSERRTVFVRAYDVDSGDVGPREPHLEFTDGLPDGIAMDSADHLWVAVWGAGEVRRYAPDGALAQRVAVPAPHTSSLAFAGRDLRRLVITTATEDLGAAQLAEYPDSGRIFLADVEIPGAPVAPWRPPRGLGG